jgi:hypothetical protein
MTFKTKIRGMTFYQNDDGQRDFQKLAVAEVHLPEMDANLRGVTLTWSKKRGYSALAPYAYVSSGQPAIHWFHRGAFAADLRDKLVDMYRRMGGDLPDAEPVRRDHVTGKPIGPDPFDDANAGAIEYRTVPFTLTSINGKPVGDEPEDDATGLRAFLGVDPAVAETMDHAGL